MTNYEILGISESATDEEVKEAYRALKKKYNEDRWLEGEAGTQAARMIEKVDAAYEEIMRSRRESRREEGGALDEVADLIRKGDLAGAQGKLDSFNERSAEWHYLQSVVFYKKNWINESKKQLEIAMQMDGANAKYRDAYEKLRARAEYKSQSGNGEAQPMPDPSMDEQMGGNWCTSLWNTCACMSWLWCCCSACR